MTKVDPLLEKLCNENGLTPDDFLSEKELYELGKPDEEGE